MYCEPQRRVLYARGYCTYRDRAVPRLRQLFKLRIYERGYVFLSEQLLQYLRAALVACAEENLSVGEFTPRQIKLAVVGTGTADKEQVQYMVSQLLSLDSVPSPDHAADALAAAICYTTHEGFGGLAK